MSSHILVAFCFLLQDGEEEGKEEFAIVFAAMGVNMETAHYFKQVLKCASDVVLCLRREAKAHTCRLSHGNTACLSQLCLVSGL